MFVNLVPHHSSRTYIRESMLERLVLNFTGILGNTFHDAPVKKIYCQFRMKTVARLWS
jgi:hypothetical protein